MKGLQCECAGVKGLSTAHTSGRGGVVNTSIRPSLNHLDAEPCICAVIKSFREENAGQAFVYQVCVCACVRACVCVCVCHCLLGEGLEFVVLGCLSKRAGLAGTLEFCGARLGREERG